MVRCLFIICLFSVLGIACNDKYEEPETAIDAGRQFISAIYNGNFKRAGQLIMKEEPNPSILKDSIEADFRSRDGFGKEALSKASIRVIKVTALDSTSTIMEYTNAYSQSPGILAILKMDGKWRVVIKKWR